MLEYRGGREWGDRDRDGSVVLMLGRLGPEHLKFVQRVASLEACACGPVERLEASVKFRFVVGMHSKFSVVGVVTATVERLAGGVVKALRRGSAPTKMRVARAIARHRQPQGAAA